MAKYPSETVLKAVANWNWSCLTDNQKAKWSQNNRKKRV